MTELGKYRYSWYPTSVVVLAHLSNSYHLDLVNLKKTCMTQSTFKYMPIDALITLLRKQDNDQSMDINFIKSLMKMCNFLSKTKYIFETLMYSHDKVNQKSSIPRNPCCVRNIAKCEWLPRKCDYLTDAKVIPTYMFPCDTKIALTSLISHAKRKGLSTYWCELLYKAEGHGVISILQL